MPCVMKRIFVNKPGCRAGKLSARDQSAGRQVRCQEKTRVAEKVAQDTEVGVHPHVGFVGNDLLIIFYLKLDRTHQNLCA